MLTQVKAMSRKTPHGDGMAINFVLGNRRRLKSLRQLISSLTIAGLVWGTAGCQSTAHHHGGKPLELDRGQKWSVPTPMMSYLRNIEQAVQNFDQQPGQNSATLAKTIQDNLSGLVTHCTMEGKAHDELHKWLIPFLALSDDYAKATNPQVQEAKRQEIKQSLAVFNSFFQ